jgi:hypothetical protein
MEDGLRSLYLLSRGMVDGTAVTGVDGLSMKKKDSPGNGKAAVAHQVAETVRCVPLSLCDATRAASVGTTRASLGFHRS